MKKLILFLLAVILTVYVGHVFAKATQETGDRARPTIAYGKTATGALKPILVTADGTVQTS